MGTICLKCQILFSAKNEKKKEISDLPSAELAKRVVTVKVYMHILFIVYTDKT